MRALGRLRSERCLDGRQQPPGQIRALLCERRRAALDGERDLLQRHSPERVPAYESLPEHDTDRPDVARRIGFLACESLGCDVRERPRDVSDSRQRVRAVELRQTEVEKADRDRVAVLQEDVRRLDVTVDDARPVRMGERVENLRGDLDGATVTYVVSTEGVADGSPRDVLVGDVDVARVVADVVRAHAALVAKPPRRERLALRAGGRFPFPGDDLERDVEPGDLVPREPDGAVPAASQGPDGAVAVEDQLPGGKGMRKRGHR